MKNSSVMRIPDLETVPFICSISHLCQSLSLVCDSNTWHMKTFYSGITYVDKFLRRDWSASKFLRRDWSASKFLRRDWSASLWCGEGVPIEPGLSVEPSSSVLCSSSSAETYSSLSLSLSSKMSSSISRPSSSYVLAFFGVSWRKGSTIATGFGGTGDCKSCRKETRKLLSNAAYVPMQPNKKSLKIILKVNSEKFKVLCRIRNLKSSAESGI